MDDNIAATEALDLSGHHAALAQRLAIASGWRRFHATYPVILGPVSTQQMFSKEFDLGGQDATTELWRAHRLTVSVNLLGLPSLALPMGVSTDGLPEGVQLIGIVLRRGRLPGRRSRPRGRGRDHHPTGEDHRMSTQEMGPEPTLQPAFAVEVQVLLPHTIGDTGSGFRRIFPIVGGRVLGPRLSGTVLPVGADWSVVRPDGVTELYARYAIRTDDGDIIDVINAGLMHGLPARDPEPGEALAEPDLFCRTTPRLRSLRTIAAVAQRRGVCRHLRSGHRSRRRGRLHRAGGLLHGALTGDPDPPAWTLFVESATAQPPMRSCNGWGSCDGLSEPVAERASRVRMSCEP